MKTLKSATAIFIIFVLSILTGCSDQLISPVAQSSGSDQKVNIAEENTKDVLKYQSKISLKPNESYSYSYENTGFYSFSSISVLNCGDIKSGLDISGYMDDQAIILDCNSTGFYAWSITIVNTTGEAVDLDVTLTGSKKRVIIQNPPVKSEF